MGPTMAAKQQDEFLEIENWEEIDETDVRATLLFVNGYLLLRNLQQKNDFI